MILKMNNNMELDKKLGPPRGHVTGYRPLRIDTAGWRNAWAVL